jgi:general secretion pathway protein G
LAIFLGIAVFFAIKSGVHQETATHNKNRYDIVGGIKNALDEFKVDNGFYPKNLQDFLQQPSGTTNWHGPYLEKIPVDPWGNPYFYECPGKHNTIGYDLFSAGPDGKPGTDDDIVNWTK